MCLHMSSSMDLIHLLFYIFFLSGAWEWKQRNTESIKMQHFWEGVLQNMPSIEKANKNLIFSLSADVTIKHQRWEFNTITE